MEDLKMKNKLFATLLSSFLFISASAQIINVPGDEPSIQAGIIAATDGDTVLVADGIYYENIRFLGKAITVASEFIWYGGDTSHIANTIIDGSQGTVPDSSATVMFIHDEDTTSIISGFTIRKGTGVLWQGQKKCGGGIFICNAGAKILDNKIIDNHIFHDQKAGGAGIGCQREGSNYWVVIRNNTISNNSSTVDPITSSSAYGGGIYSSASAIISNNDIKNNSCINSGNFTDAYADGGGIEIEHKLGSNPPTIAEISNNNISNNNIEGYKCFGGGIAVYYASVNITNNSIRNNKISPTTDKWYGAGVYCKTPIGMTLIRGNEFSFNSGPVAPVGAGGGLCLWDADQTSIVVNANRFHHNTAYHGGGVFERSSYNIYLSNNIFNGNITYMGGGIGMFHPAKKSGSSLSEAKDFHPQIMNNTFYSDSANSDGGAIRFEGVMNAPEIVNCIFWENTAASGKDIQNFSSLPVIVSYSDLATNTIAGQWTGEGNIYADPQFMPLDQFCHLSESSPCRDTGIVSFQAPLFDYDGDSRPDPVFALMDMGADEYYEIPAAPVAMDPIEVGYDYFIASWQKSLWAQRYYLDVAMDENFNTILPAYNNFDVGIDTMHMVENLDTGLFYYYRVKAYNGSGVSPNSNTITVDLLNVGINEGINPISGLRIHIYPNPFLSSMTIKYEPAKPGNVIITVFNHLGQQMERIDQGYFQSEKKQYVWNASGLPSGIYFVQVRARQEMATRKVIKMR